MESVLSKLAAQPENAFPSKGGLYPHELLMLAYAPYYHTNGEGFHDFWYFQYHIEQPRALLESLLQRGFLIEGDLISALEHQPIAVLQEELHQLGRATTGDKATLIERLISETTFSALAEKYAERNYLLTESGQRELRENPYILYLHRHGFMDIWEMNRILGPGGDGQAFRPILLEHFARKSQAHLQAENYVSYRNQQWEMYEFQRENGEDAAAFQLLCEAALYDLSGLGNGEKQKREFYQTDGDFQSAVLQESLKHHFPYEESSLRLSEELIAALREYQHDMKSEFRTRLTEAVGSIRLPRSVFTTEEAIDILLWELEGNGDELISLYTTVEFRQKAALMKLL